MSYQTFSCNPMRNMIYRLRTIAGSCFYSVASAVKAGKGLARRRDVLAAGLHVQCRARSDVNLPVLEVLLDGTYLRGSPTAASRRMRHNAQTARTYLGMTVPRH